MELFLIRHAQTDYSKRKQYCSFTDVPLNKTGICQAKDLRVRIKDLSADIIFCSAYKRAKETAKIMFPRRKIITTASLAELNFGKWEALTYEEIMQQYPSLYDRWLDNPYAYAPLAGEKLSDLEKRVDRFLENVLAEYADKKVFCVSHAGPIKIMAGKLLKKKLKSFWDVTINLASLSYFKLKNKEVISYKLNQ